MKQFLVLWFLLWVRSIEYGIVVKNDPPWNTCVGEVTSQDMCVCVLVCLSLLVCTRQNRFDPRFRVK